MNENVDEEKNEELCPTLILINRLSGGQEGERIYRKSLRLLNPRQVFLLESNCHLQWIFHLYRHLKNVSILICGGDGTVGWILSTLAEYQSPSFNPSISICPLGTGNDLSRVFGWGWKFQMNRFEKQLEILPLCHSHSIDRWKIHLHNSPPPPPPGGVDDDRLSMANARDHQCCSFLISSPKFVEKNCEMIYKDYLHPQNIRFVNYFSFGLDGAVVLDFHHHRLTHPDQFTSPLKNKFIYLNLSRKYWKEFLFFRSWDLFSSMRLILDGEDFSQSLRYCHSIVLLNIPSYGSGTRPWTGGLPKQNLIKQSMKKKRNSSSSFDASPTDGKLEILGLSSIEMTLIHLGFRARRIGQAHHVQIDLLHSMPVHMDGDPFYLLPNTSIEIHHDGQVPLLNHP